MKIFKFGNRWKNFNPYYNLIEAVFDIRILKIYFSILFKGVVVFGLDIDFSKTRYWRMFIDLFGFSFGIVSPKFYY